MILDNREETMYAVAWNAGRSTNLSTSVADPAKVEARLFARMNGLREFPKTFGARLRLWKATAGFGPHSP